MNINERRLHDGFALLQAEPNEGAELIPRAQQSIVEVWHTARGRGLRPLRREQEREEWQSERYLKQQIRLWLDDNGIGEQIGRFGELLTDLRDQSKRLEKLQRKQQRVITDVCCGGMRSFFKSLRRASRRETEWFVRTQDRQCVLCLRLEKINEAIEFYSNNSAEADRWLATMRGRQWGWRP